MNYIKFIRIFLLVLIIIGIGLLLTQKIWVPKAVEMILKNENPANSIPVQILQTKNSVSQTNKISWQGIWYRDSDQFTPGTLTISKVTPSSFNFSLDVFYGAHVGSAEGVAVVNGTKAKSIFDKNIDDSCDLIFTFSSSSIDVEFGDLVKNGPALCPGMGVGVVPIGTYSFQKTKPISNSILETDTFSNQTEQATFKNLVGSYLNIFNSTAQVETPDTDIDGFSSQVTDWFVFGLGNSQSSVIMIAPGNKIWTAVTDTDNSGNAIIRYFTNVPKYTNEVPQTIQNYYSNVSKFLDAQGKVINLNNY